MSPCLLLELDMFQRYFYTSCPIIEERIIRLTKRVRLLMRRIIEFGKMKKKKSWSDIKVIIIDTCKPHKSVPEG